MRAGRAAPMGRGDFAFAICGRNSLTMRACTVCSEAPVSFCGWSLFQVESEKTRRCDMRCRDVTSSTSRKLSRVSAGTKVTCRSGSMRVERQPCTTKLLSKRKVASCLSHGRTHHGETDQARERGSAGSAGRVRGTGSRDCL